MTISGRQGRNGFDRATEGADRRGPGTASRCAAFFAAAITVMALSSCTQGGSKDYDIAPIFPLSSDKCARYDGTAEGSGFGAHCWVTKEKCEQAAQDWRQSMQQGGVTDAVDFTCN